jgi:hypothetical protein
MSTLCERSSLSVKSESAKQISGEQEKKPDEQCLEAVRAHDRDGDMGIAHQECEEGKQDRKNENRPQLAFEGFACSSNVAGRAPPLSVRYLGLGMRFARSACPLSFHSAAS